MKTQVLTRRSEETEDCEDLGKWHLVRICISHSHDDRWNVGSGVFTYINLFSFLFPFPRAQMTLVRPF